MLLVKLRFRLLGPLVTLAELRTPPTSRTTNSIELAVRNVDRALDAFLESLAVKAA